MNYEIFLSYSRQDADFALSFGKDLKNDGYNIFIDQLDIRAGGTWDNQIEKALEECKVVLVLVSSKSVISSNVLNEISYAIDEAKEIIPIKIENCKVPLLIKRYQFIDFTINYNLGIEKLKKFLLINRGLFYTEHSNSNTINVNPPDKISTSFSEEEKSKIPKASIPTAKSTQKTIMFIFIILAFITAIAIILYSNPNSKKLENGVSDSSRVVAITDSPILKDILKSSDSLSKNDTSQSKFQTIKKENKPYYAQWSPSELRHGCGHTENDIHITYATDDCSPYDDSGITGYSTYGPYIQLPTGDYMVTWEIALVKDIDPNTSITQLQVQDFTNVKMLAQQDLSYNSFQASDKFQKISLNFRVVEDRNNDKFEFRVVHFGNATIKLKEINLKKFLD